MSNTGRHISGNSRSNFGSRTDIYHDDDQNDGLEKNTGRPSRGQYNYRNNRRNFEHRTGFFHYNVQNNGFERSTGRPSREQYDSGNSRKNFEPGTGIYHNDDQNNGCERSTDRPSREQYNYRNNRGNFEHRTGFFHYDVQNNGFERSMSRPSRGQSNSGNNRGNFEHRTGFFHYDVQNNGFERSMGRQSRGQYNSGNNRGKSRNGIYDNNNWLLKVYGFPEDSTEDELREELSLHNYSTFLRIIIRRNVQTHNPTTFALVEFKEYEEATIAFSTIDGSNIREMKISAQFDRNSVCTYETFWKQRNRQTDDFESRRFQDNEYNCSTNNRGDKFNGRAKSMGKMFNNYSEDNEFMHPSASSHNNEEPDPSHRKNHYQSFQKTPDFQNTSDEEAPPEDVIERPEFMHPSTSSYSNEEPDPSYSKNHYQSFQKTPDFQNASDEEAPPKDVIERSGGEESEFMHQSTSSDSKNKEPSCSKNHYQSFQKSADFQIASDEAASKGDALERPSENDPSHYLKKFEAKFIIKDHHSDQEANDSDPENVDKPTDFVDRDSKESLYPSEDVSSDHQMFQKTEIPDKIRTLEEKHNAFKETSNKPIINQSPEKRDYKSTGPCKKCGTKHPWRQCPAHGETCEKCGMKNHFSEMCQSTKTKTCMQRIKEASDSLYQSTISQLSKNVDSKSIRKPCTKCGRNHPWQNCPAYGQNCTNCGKLNHFAAVCQSTKTYRSKDTNDFNGNSSDSVMVGNKERIRPNNIDYDKNSSQATMPKEH